MVTALLPELRPMFDMTTVTWARCRIPVSNSYCIIFSCASSLLGQYWKKSRIFSSNKNILVKITMIISSKPATPKVHKGCMWDAYKALNQGVVRHKLKP